LLILGQGIAPAALAKPHCAERAGRPSGQLARCLLYSPQQAVLVFQLGRLGRHETEHNTLAIGDEAQGREIAGAIGVV
jgi:hypothetical protein